MPIPQAERNARRTPDPDDVLYDPDDTFTQADLIDDLYTLELWDDIDEWEGEA